MQLASKCEPPNGVSRSGEMPEPTVIVRMEEDVQTVMSVSRVCRGAFASALNRRCRIDGVEDACRSVCLQCPETFFAPFSFARAFHSCPIQFSPPPPRPPPLPILRNFAQATRLL